MRERSRSEAWLRWLAACAVLFGAGACSRQVAAGAGPAQVQVDPLLIPADRGTNKVGGTGEASGTVSFAAFGDTDQRSPEGQRRVARALAAVCAAAGCDFVLLLGDNFYPTGVTSETDPLFQTGFEEPYAGVPAPFFAVLGNHDYGAALGFRKERALHQVAYSKRSSKFRMPGLYWREARGPVELFGLDTTAEFYGQGGEQAAEAERWVASSTAPWKIALGHHPYLSNGPHMNAGDEGGSKGAQLKAFLERVACGRVDLYLSGHDHNQQWLRPTCRGTELIVSGAAASSYELSELNPVHFQSAELGFLYARVTERTFTGYFVDAQGKVGFTRTLAK